MSRLQPLAVVLWGPDFDGVVAASLVCGLRRAGVRVKLVGVQGRPVAGQQGLTLLPDLALGQVGKLAAPIACLAIPCAAAYLAALLSDPRVGELWQRALADEACWVVPADWPSALLANSARPPLLYPTASVLAPVVAEVVLALTGREADWSITCLPAGADILRSG